MKRIIKYSLLTVFVLLLTVAFVDNALAKKTYEKIPEEGTEVYHGGSTTKQCDKDHKDGCYCAEFSKDNCQPEDGYGNECMLDYNTLSYCVPKKEKVTCEDFHTNRLRCETVKTDENGNACVFDTTKNACTYKYPDTADLKAHCIEYTASEEECPVNGKDRSGDTCVKDMSGKGYCRPSNKPRLTCEDYYGNKTLCATGVDDIGNTCSFDDEKGTCYTSIKENLQVCEDYKDYCHAEDDIGDTCKLVNGQCTTIVYQSEVNHGFTNAVLEGEDPLLYVYKDIEINLIEDDTGFVCSDVKYLTNAWLFIRILSPFLIVLFGSLDFFKAMIASDEKKMQQARTSFVKRLVAFILLIILPFVLQFIFSTIGTFGSENVCLLKCIATNDTSEKGCD